MTGILPIKKYGTHSALNMFDEFSMISASEILSGALKDYNKAKLLGTKTYGKGMVQKIIPMPNETGINLTVAKYLTPKGTDINKKGITPDIKVVLSIQDVKNNNDAQLQAAKNTLSQMMLSKR